jgi:hypothetical protein
MIPASDSEGIRRAVPIYSGRPFRFNPADDSDRFRQKSERSDAGDKIITKGHISSQDDSCHFSNTDMNLPRTKIIELIDGSGFL